MSKCTFCKLPSTRKRMVKVDGEILELPVCEDHFYGSAVKDPEPLNWFYKFSNVLAGWLNIDNNNKGE